MAMKYTEIVLEHFRNPRNIGKIKNADAKATEGNIRCGDMMTIYLKIKDNIIKDAKFESYGCAASIATASILTTIIKEKTIEQAEKLTWRDIIKKLGGLPPLKFHCSNLAIETLHSAIKKWKEKNKIKS